MQPIGQILIYGPGAVGLGIGSCLIHDGQRVGFLGTETTIAALERHGLHRTGIFGDGVCEPGAFGCVRGLSEIPEASVDQVLVCTKSYDSLRVAEDLAAHRAILRPSAAIILFQNGWGAADVFTRYFYVGAVYNARVITGFEKPEPHRVNITVHAADILLGSLFGAPLDTLEPLSASIGRGGIPCRVTAHIVRDLWAKMLYNCTLNPLGALLNLPYGALAKSLHTRSLMDHLAQEIFRVMKLHDYQTHWHDPEAFLHVFYETLIPRTAAHESSMLQDIRAGKRTEIDALNGAVLRLAQSCHTDAPYNACMVDLVKAAESGPALHRARGPGE